MQQEIIQRTIETADTLDVEVLEQRFVAQILVLGDHLEGKTCEQHVELDAIKRHLDDRHKRLLHRLKDKTRDYVIYIYCSSQHCDRKCSFGYIIVQCNAMQCNAMQCNSTLLSRKREIYVQRSYIIKNYIKYNRDQKIKHLNSPPTNVILIMVVASHWNVYRSIHIRLHRI